jgi:hypothetical protein
MLVGWSCIQGAMRNSCGGTCIWLMLLRLLRRGLAGLGQAPEVMARALSLGRLVGYARSSCPGDDITPILSSPTERLRQVIPEAGLARDFANLEAADAATLMTIHRASSNPYVDPKIRAPCTKRHLGTELKRCCGFDLSVEMDHRRGHIFSTWRSPSPTNIAYATARY